MRKRDKTIASNGQAPKVDLETLRAATRAAGGGNGNGDRDGPSRQKTQTSQNSASHSQQGDAMQEDDMGATGSNSNPPRQPPLAPPPQQAPQSNMVSHYGYQDAEMSVVHPHAHPQQSPPAMPPPASSSWATSMTSAQRGYAPPESSSFVRASHARSSAS